jgi:hypothetical protein
VTGLIAAVGGCVGGIYRIGGGPVLAPILSVPFALWCTLSRGQYVRVAEVRVVAGRYRLVKPLGRGGFSEVWQAEDGVLGRAVAVKLFTAPVGQPDLVARFHREARTVAGLRHPNVVVVFDAGVDESVPYVVMELLGGPSLDGLLAARGPHIAEYALLAQLMPGVTDRAQISHSGVLSGHSPAAWAILGRASSRAWVRPLALARLGRCCWWLHFPAW